MAILTAGKTLKLTPRRCKYYFMASLCVSIFIANKQKQIYEGNYKKFEDNLDHIYLKPLGNK